MVKGEASLMSKKPKKVDKVRKRFVVDVLMPPLFDANLMRISLVGMMVHVLDCKEKTAS